jgi:hypothetical protein
MFFLLAFAFAAARQQHDFIWSNVNFGFVRDDNARFGKKNLMNFFDQKAMDEEINMKSN